MPLGISLGRLYGLVRETRELQRLSDPVSVSGSRAGELAAALSVGGDPAAVRVDGDPSRALASIRFIDDEPSEAEIGVLRRAARAGLPLLVVRNGGCAPIPSVLPENVIADGVDLPVAQIVEALAHAAGRSAPALAARLPLLRPAVQRRLIGSVALVNAFTAASPRTKEGHFRLITFTQARMLFLLRVSRGDMLPDDPKELVVAAGPPLVGAFGMGLAARELARRSPVGGPVVRAALAYAGTLALGAARLRL